jgi:epoxyqueuosine reductase
MIEVLPTIEETPHGALKPGILDSAAIKRHAQALGLDGCGITSADPSHHAAFFRQWAEEGRAGEMAWMTRELDRRSDPRAVLPGARSMIVAGLNYWQPARTARGRIARYALGDDYHEVLMEKLRALADLMAAGGAAAKVYVDTGPVLEKPLAARAGLGWQGKSTMLINRRLGPWLLLGEIITTLALEPDAPERDHCGSCSRCKCIDICPTQAITAPYQLDARRCIAYLTIELKGSIPEELRPLIGDRIYGCDECLDVCPWNRFAQATREARFHAPDELRHADLRELLDLTAAGFRRRFARSPILRVKRRGLLRNVCVVLGNIGTTEDLPALHRAQQHEEPLVREHAAWAVRQIEKRLERDRLPNDSQAQW